MKRLLIGRSTYFNFVLMITFSILMVIVNSGCKKNSFTDETSSQTPSTGTPITGTVSAPSGSLGAMASSQSFEAGIGPMAAVGNTKVELIQIDNTGAQVGSVLATHTTGSDGKYSLTAPSTFTAGATHAIRASGSSSTMIALAHSNSVDVDPISDATKSLVISGLASGSLSEVTPEDVQTVQKMAKEISNEVSTSGQDVATMAATIKAAIQNDPDSDSVVKSIGYTTNIINGTVTDSSGNKLSGYDVVVRDYLEREIKATTITDANGKYRIKVPAGDYIVGVVNRTSTKLGSEFYTDGGGVANYWFADKVTLSANGKVTRDFVLDPGGKISGTVTASSGGTALAGIKILVRDSFGAFIAAARTDENGAYSISIRPGVYYLVAQNSTLLPYASTLYDASAAGGTATGSATNGSQATLITVAADTSITANFQLVAGNSITGTVSDPSSGAVSGINVRLYEDESGTTVKKGAFIDALKSDKSGGYKVWLKAGKYSIRARGQVISSDISSGNLTAQNFSAAVATITGTMIDASSNPAAAIKVFTVNTAGTNQGNEFCRGDGTFTVYSTVSPVIIAVRSDNGQTIGSSIYNGQTVTTSGTQTSVTVGGSAVSIGSVTLPNGAVVTGTVTVSGAAVGNYLVQVRSGGTAAGNAFVLVRSRSDGSYSLSLPSGSFYIRACDPSNCTGSFTSITVSPPTAMTQNFAL